MIRPFRPLLAAILTLASSAASAEIVTRENISAEFGIAKLTIPKIEADIAAGTRPDFEALFREGSNEPFHARLARLKAERMTIPLLRFQITMKEGVMTVSYKDVVISKLAGGKAVSVTSSANETKMEAGGKALSDGSNGATSISQADLAFMIRFFTDSRGASNDPMRPLYESYVVDNTVSKDAASGLEIRIGKVTGKGFKARLLATAPMDLIPLFTSLSDGAKPSKQTQMALFRFMADAYASVDMGSGEASSISMKGPGKKGVGEGKILQIYYGPGADSGKAGFVMNGLEINAPDGKFGMGRMTVAGFSIEPTLKHMIETIEKEGDIEKVDPFKMIPGLGVFRMNDMTFDIQPDGKGERVAGAVKLYELSAGEQINGIPTSLRFALGGLSMPLAADSKEKGIRDLRELGYTRLDISTLTDLAWDPKASELRIKDASISGADMGTLKITGALGRVTADLFSGDKALMTAAAMGATAKTLNVYVENRGLFEKALAKTAKDQKTKPEDLRQQMAAVASMGIPAILGGSAGAKAISAAVSRFVAKPGKLTIDVKTKDGSGLGVFDFMSAASNPAALMDKLNIEAKAE